jgi:hypothetical protein
MEFLPERKAERLSFHVLHRVQIEHLEQCRQQQAQRLTAIPVSTKLRLVIEKPDGVVRGHHQERLTSAGRRIRLRFRLR